MCWLMSLILILIWYPYPQLVPTLCSTHDPLAYVYGWICVFPLGVLELLKHHEDKDIMFSRCFSLCSGMRHSFIQYQRESVCLGKKDSWGVREALGKLFSRPRGGSPTLALYYNLQLDAVVEPDVVSPLGNKVVLLPVQRSLPLPYNKKTPQHRGNSIPQYRSIVQPC